MNMFKKLAVAIVMLVGFTLPAFAVDLAITATAVVPTASTVVIHGTAGATITAGQVVYLDTNNVYQLANAVALATTKFSGIALNNASANQALSVAVAGHITYNAVLTKGVAVYLSAANAGGQTLVGALVSTNGILLLGVTTSTTDFQIGVVNSGVTL